MHRPGQVVAHRRLYTDGQLADHVNPQAPGRALTSARLQAHVALPRIDGQAEAAGERLAEARLLELQRLLDQRLRADDDAGGVDRVLADEALERLLRVVDAHLRAAAR